MSKVGIITMYSKNNFGNKLQNYALKKILENDFEAEVFTIVKKKFDFDLLVKNLIRKILSTNGYKRESLFSIFDKRLNIVKWKKARKAGLDYIVVGSDQVWNYMLDDFDECLFFAKGFDGSKKISYAASIGVPEIDIDKIGVFVKGLKEFKNISVRETVAGEELNKIIKNKNIETVLDPTMLLDVDDWREIEKKPHGVTTERRFILLYCLGDLSSTLKNEVAKVSEQYDCEIVNIFDKNNEYYVNGPEEFLWFIDHAFLVCTDSFHASAFSFLFEKPFLVFDRKEKRMDNLASRIDTLIEKFELKNRRFDGVIRDENLIVDYSIGKENLEKEREKSLKFLKDALETKKQ